MDDRASQFRQQPILLGVPDFQLNKPTGKIFVVRQCTDFRAGLCRFFSVRIACRYLAVLGC
jgi:hypothetical protein